MNLYVVPSSYLLIMNNSARDRCLAWVTPRSYKSLDNLRKNAAKWLGKRQRSSMPIGPGMEIQAGTVGRRVAGEFKKVLLTWFDWSNASTSCTALGDVSALIGYRLNSFEGGLHGIM